MLIGLGDVVDVQLEFREFRDIIRVHSDATIQYLL